MTHRTKWFIIALIFALILLLIKQKAFAPAAIVGGVVTLAGIIQRLMVFLTIRNQWRAYQASRSQSKQSGGATEPKMDEVKAREILDLPDDYDAEAVKKAYHRIIRQNHPDTGGSKFLAAQVNEAREVLERAIAAREPKD